MEKRSLFSITLSYLLADYSRHKYWGETKEIQVWFDSMVLWPTGLVYIQRGNLLVPDGYCIILDGFLNRSSNPNGWFLACYEVSLSLQNGPTGQDPSLTRSTRCTEDMHVLLPGHILGMQVTVTPSKLPLCFSLPCIFFFRAGVRL